jgi:hypothetical protein
MPTVDFAWVKAQLTESKTRAQSGNAVLALLEAWDKLDLTEAAVEDTLALFEKLARTESLVKTAEGEWVQARAGFVRKADTVQVKAGAFKGPKGVALNGRTGVVVALRYGDVVVDLTDDKGPVGKGLHFKPEDILIKR